MSETVYCVAGDINSCKVFLLLRNLHSTLVIRSINSYTEKIFSVIQYVEKKSQTLWNWLIQLVQYTNQVIIMDFIIVV